MIIELLINLVTALIKGIFGFINLPQAPEGAKAAIDSYFNLIFDNLGFLNFFVNVSTLKIVAIISIALIVFVDLYKVTMWIYHKLPISSN